MSDGGGSRIYRVFLSSTAGDLATHRQLVLEALNGFDVVKLVNQEAFGARAAASTVDECRRFVEASDLVVVVVAHRYGWVPTEAEGGDDKLSITALEVEAARSKPRLVFLVDEGQSWPYTREQDDLTSADADPHEVQRRVRLLGEFRERLQAGHIVEWFTTAEDLAVKVTRAVSNVIVGLVRETGLRSAVGMTDRVAGAGEPGTGAEALFRWQQPRESPEQPIEPLLVRTTASLMRGRGECVPLRQFFHAWFDTGTAAPMVAIVDFPLDIVDSIGRLAAGDGYGYCNARLDLLELSFEEIQHGLLRLTADHEVRTLFVDFSQATLEDAARASPRVAVCHPIREFLDRVFRAAERAGVRCAALIPRYLTRRPYVSTLPETPFVCETAPLFDDSYGGRLQWLLTATKIRRIGPPLDRLLSVNSDSAVRLVADFLRAHAISGTLEVTPTNPGSLDVLAGLADLLARSRFYELAFRLERYCRTFQAARTDLPLSANLYPRSTAAGEPGVIGLLRDAATLPPTLDRAVLLSAPGGGKSTVLKQIDQAATVPEPATVRSAPVVTFVLARSSHDQAGIAGPLIHKLRSESLDGGRTFRAHQTLAEVLPRVRLGDVFSSRTQLLLDTDGVLRATDLAALENDLVGSIGPPETTGYLLSVTNETPPAERPIPCIELRRLTTAQIERSFDDRGERIREFLDLERFVTGLDGLLRSPFLLLALTRQPAGERLAIGGALGRLIEARTQGLPRRDEIYRSLTRAARTASLEPLRDLDPDPDWLTEATETRLVARAGGTVRVRFENTLIREYFLARAIAETGGATSPETPAVRLLQAGLEARSRSRVGVLCVDFLERSDVPSFVRELAAEDPVLAHTAALYAAWRTERAVLTPETRATAEAVLRLAATRPSRATLLTALGPADPRVAPSRVRESMVATSGEEPSAFKIAQYLTTNGEFLAFVKDGGYARPEFWSEEGIRWHSRAGQPRQPRTWSHPELTGPNLPVRGVSFFEAEAYCGWLSAQHDDVAFWLPTAPLWDLVAHGEQRDVWSAVLDGVRATSELFSDAPAADGYLTSEVVARLLRMSRSAASLGDRAMRSYSGAASHNAATPIGANDPNALGVYDMYGLCWQWCATALDGSDIEPFWSAARQQASGAPVLVKGGTAGGRNPSAVWSFIGSWFMPEVQYDGIGFRTMSFDR